MDDTAWACDLTAYTCTRTDSAPPQSDSRGSMGSRFGRGRRGQGQGPGRGRNPTPESPDGKWKAMVKDNNFAKIHSS